MSKWGRVMKIYVMQIFKRYSIIQGIVQPGLLNSRFVYSGNVYYLASLGSECPVSDIVSNVEDCQAAAAKLRRVYMHEINGASYPAGCFYWSTDNEVYLNIRNSSDTHGIKSKAGGVCKKSMA